MDPTFRVLGYLGTFVVLCIYHVHIDKYCMRKGNTYIVRNTVCTGSAAMDNWMS